MPGYNSFLVTAAEQTALIPRAFLDDGLAMHYSAHQLVFNNVILSTTRKYKIVFNYIQHLALSIKVEY